MAAIAEKTTKKSVEEKPFIDDSWSMPRLVAYFAPDRKIDYTKLKKDLVFLTAKKIAALLKKLAKYADEQFWSFLAENIKAVQDFTIRQALANKNTFLGTSESIEKGTLISEEELEADGEKAEENKSQKEDSQSGQEKPESEKEGGSEEKSDESEEKKKNYNTGGPYTKGFFDKDIIAVEFDLPEGITPENLEGWLLYVMDVYFEDHVQPMKSGRKVIYKLGAIRPGDPQEGKEVYKSLAELKKSIVKSLKEEKAAAARNRKASKKHKAVSREPEIPDEDDMLIDPWEEEKQDGASEEEWNALDEEVEEESNRQNNPEQEERTQREESKNSRTEKTAQEDKAETSLRKESPAQQDPAPSSLPEDASSQTDCPWLDQSNPEARKDKEEKNQCLKPRPPLKPPGT